MRYQMIGFLANAEGEGHGYMSRFSLTLPLFNLCSLVIDYSYRIPAFLTGFSGA